jgi:hypothetical protein
MTIVLDIACSEATWDERKATQLWEGYFQRLNTGAHQLRKLEAPELPAVISLEGLISIDDKEGNGGNSKNAAVTLGKLQTNPGVQSRINPAAPSAVSAPIADSQTLSFETTHNTRKLASGISAPAVASPMPFTSGSSSTSRSRLPPYKPVSGEGVTTGLARKSSQVPTPQHPPLQLPGLKPSLFSAALPVPEKAPLLPAPEKATPLPAPEGAAAPQPGSSRSVPRNSNRAPTPGPSSFASHEEESTHTDDDDNSRSSSTSRDNVESDNTTVPKLSARKPIVVSSNEESTDTDDDNDSRSSSTSGDNIENDRKTVPKLSARKPIVISSDEEDDGAGDGTPSPPRPKRKPAVQRRTFSMLKLA